MELSSSNVRSRAGGKAIFYSEAEKKKSFSKTPVLTCSTLLMLSVSTVSCLGKHSFIFTLKSSTDTARMSINPARECFVVTDPRFSPEAALTGRISSEIHLFSSPFKEMPVQTHKQLHRSTQQRFNCFSLFFFFYSRLISKRFPGPYEGDRLCKTTQ